MYENITYKLILQRMLERVPNSIDKREGSIIYDALAPAAAELMMVYIELERILNESFGDTASREYLARRAEERGITPKEATHAILKGEFLPASVNVINTRYSLGQLNYIVKEQIAPGVYKVQCETAGVEGNKLFGDLIPIDYIDGLESSILTELLIPGEDEEDTEVFRRRYFDSFRSQAFGGNIAEYKEKVNGIDGVGGVKVYPVWNGGGTVKLVIIDSNYARPSSELIESVQTVVDPTQNQGIGEGIAPIGHIVTVVGCGETTLDVQTSLTFESGWDWIAIEPYVQACIDDYFRELARGWDSSENIIVRISQIETRLLSLTGILDIKDTTLNHTTQNFIVPADNIPIRGLVSNV